MIAAALRVCTDCYAVLANGSDGVEYIQPDDARAFWERFSAGVEREASDVSSGIVPGGRAAAPITPRVASATRSASDTSRATSAGLTSPGIATRQA